MAWEVAKRWRTIPKATIFPAVVGYKLTGGRQSGQLEGRLKLSATRLEIAAQSTCAAGRGRQPAS